MRIRLRFMIGGGTPGSLAAVLAIARDLMIKRFHAHQAELEGRMSAAVAGALRAHRALA